MPWRVRAAIAFAPHRLLEIREIDLADPGPGEVAIRLLATGLCHSDLHIIEGLVPSRFPVILGHEGIGDIVGVGEGVTGFALGDRVIPYLMPDCGVCPFCTSGRTNFCIQLRKRAESGKTPFSLDGEPVATFVGLGTFAEMTVVPADMVVKVDRAARPDHACCIACGVTTGIGAATISADVKPGSSVVVLGVGGVGLSVVQGARLAGATKIIAVDVNEAKREVSFALGATDFINSSEVEDVGAAVRGLTGIGADYAFECVGVPALYNVAMDCTNPAWGMIVTVGVFPHGTELHTSSSAMMMGRRWTGSLMGGAKRKDVAHLVDRYVAGDFDLERLVSHHIIHDEINRGFEMMKAGTSIRSVISYSNQA